MNWLDKSLVTGTKTGNTRNWLKWWESFLSQRPWSFQLSKSSIRSRRNPVGDFQQRVYEVGLVCLAVGIAVNFLTVHFWFRRKFLVSMPWYEWGRRPKIRLNHETKSLAAWGITSMAWGCISSSCSCAMGLPLWTEYRRSTISKLETIPSFRTSIWQILAAFHHRRLGNPQNYGRYLNPQACTLFTSRCRVRHDFSNRACFLEWTVLRWNLSTRLCWAFWTNTNCLRFRNCASETIGPYSETTTMPDSGTPPALVSESALDLLELFYTTNMGLGNTASIEPIVGHLCSC